MDLVMSAGRPASGAVAATAGGSGSSSSSSDEPVYVWDVQSGAIVHTFSGNASDPGCLALIGGQYMVAAQHASATLHFWSLAKDGPPVLKASAPERVTAVAASDDGVWVAAASEAGSVYVWQVATGRQAASWSAHSKAVRQLAFVDSSANAGGAAAQPLLVTAGDDALVQLWPLAELTAVGLLGVVSTVSTASSAASSSSSASLFSSSSSSFSAAADAMSSSSTAEPRPLHTWSDHSLAVSALWTGLGRLATVSMDRSCRVWSLTSRRLELTLVLPAGATAITAEPLGCRGFIGTCDGRLWLADLRPSSTSSSPSAAAGGGVQAFGSEAHRQAVTALAVTSDGVRLVSAANDGACIVWHVPSRQRLVAFAAHKGPVTAVRLVTRHMFVAASASSSSSSSSSSSAAAGLGPIAKYRTAPAADAAGWNATVPLPAPALATDLLLRVDLTNDAFSSVAGLFALQSSTVGRAAAAGAADDGVAASERSQSELKEWQTLSSQLFHLAAKEKA